MKRRCSLVLQLLLGGLIVASAGCFKQPLKPIRFNNTIARGLTRLSGPAKKFAAALEPLAKGAPAKMSDAQSAYTEMQTNLQAVKKEFDDISPPLGSSAAPAVLAKAREFMTAQQSIFDQCITPIYNILKNNGLPDPDKYAAIAPLLKRAAELELSPKVSLDREQEAYCKEQNFTTR